MHLFFRRTAPVCGALALCIILVAPLASSAQNDADANAGTDSVATDGVGVARVSLIEGSVAIQRGDAADSLTAALNAPVLGGDYVTTGDASRAEIELDGHAQVRLGQGVQMRFTHLDATNREVQLAAGTLDVRLLGGTDGSTAIDTPSITIKPQSGGSYRVSVTADGQTLVTVRSGDAQIDTPQGNQDLGPGTTLAAQGDAGSPQIQTRAVIALDDFDQFNDERDRVHSAALAQANFVNGDIDGVDDLAANGHWVTDGSYGHVWVPAAVAPDWAPYRDGRWVWEDGYGWTWIADEPWGWAPYHYGSWYHSPSYGWCWYPPQPNVVVAWRPALVAFVGFGGAGGDGFALSFAGGNAFAQIGWVPLAPFEPYHPWWGSGYGPGGPVMVNSFNRVTNITNVTTVTNINVYRNVTYNAVSSVSSQRFLQGNFTHNVAVTASQLREARVFNGALPVVPTASNLRFSSSAAPPAVAVRPGLIARSFADRPIAVQRTPFTAQRVALATATHATLTPLHFHDAQTTPLRTDGAFAHPATGAASGDAWSRFNQTRPDRPPAAGNAYHEPAAGNVYHAAPPSDTYRAATATPSYATRAGSAGSRPHVGAEPSAAERSAAATHPAAAPKKPAAHEEQHEQPHR